MVDKEKVKNEKKGINGDSDELDTNTEEMKKVKKASMAPKQTEQKKVDEPEDLLSRVKRKL